ncbi:uncharacterized protein GGS22DRAFT_184029 [Annulohypoxylon maeteangense]|uniref:uncharacterized protein n=1 Tax=Annulohypoxylon maeteangense TaxID=1927788 RepID=UPI0020074D2E|nr:uncharacterized protein GGS22DRAFT_184029 [Annulohypoxylon maeteangense]KAI0890681.1 hypothetical protein GGS22DRAFT_184029 [Annulohypoxylon maeteangense]
MDSTVLSKETFMQGGPWEMSDIMKLSNIQDILEVLGKTSIRLFFDEYVSLHPSLEPIVAKDILPDVFSIVGESEPTYTSLYRRANDPPTNAHWAEGLFAYRMKRYLESRECMAITWRSLEYYTIRDPGEIRTNKAILLERYGIILIILERLQRERYEAAFPEPEPESEPGSRQQANPRQETTLSWLDEFILKWIPRC